MLTKSCEKVAKDFCCLNCDYNTSRKSSYDKHLLTSKHLQLTNVNKKLQKSCDDFFTCDKCNKNYKSRVGLWKHNKSCSLTTNVLNELTQDTVINILKQNSEFQNMLLEQHKTIVEMSKHNSNTLINNNSNNNSNNKTFNLQFFLNETCKDAMNITDFVDSISLQLSDLENVGKLGFVDGISNIILKNMKALDVEKRPVHCTDSKREIMYVKDQGKWYNDSKEEEQENKKLKRAIKHIANKNSKLLSEFKAKYPDCIYSYSTKSDQYNKLIIESFGGSGNNTIDNENKIIKKLAKDLTIVK